MSQRPILKYPPEKMTLAMEAIRNGMKIREASRVFGVPRATLQDRLHLRVPEGPRKMGPDTVLTRQEEEEIVNWCIKLTKCGFPLKASILLNTVHSIMLTDGRPNPFTDNKPGKKWLKAFFRRHPSITYRTAEEISKGRAVITEEYIRKWFKELKESLISQNALDILDDPRRIFNGDETSFMICPKTGKVVAPRGYKNVYQIAKGNEKEAITTLAVFSADGDILPPCVVFPYVRPPKDVVNSMPEQWFLGKSDTGWIKSDIFYDYVAKGFDKWLTENNVQKPVLFFVDGHKSHLTMKLSEFCHENGIILYALPPNTTHMMQPADVSVFKPLKADWKNTINDWSSQPENANKCLTKATFCPLLKKILEKDSLKSAIKNGFRKCGLYPFDPDQVDYTKCVLNNTEKIKRTSSSKSPKKGLKKRDYDLASKIITHLSKDLSERGVDVAVVLEVIKSAKNSQGLDASHASNTTLDHSQDQPTTSSANVIKEHESGFQTPISDNFSLPNLGESTLFNNLEILDLQTGPGSFDLNDNSVMLLNCDSDIITAMSPNTQNSSKVNVSESVTVASYVSPAVRAHLIIPSPKKKTGTPRLMNRIGAISSQEWRDFEKQKEDEKRQKKANIAERKLQREKAKQVKLSEAARKREQKLKNTRVNKKYTQKRKLNFSQEKDLSDDDDETLATKVKGAKTKELSLENKIKNEILTAKSSPSTSRDSVPASSTIKTTFSQEQDSSDDEPLVKKNKDNTEELCLDKKKKIEILKTKSIPSTSKDTVPIKTRARAHCTTNTACKYTVNLETFVLPPKLNKFRTKPIKTDDDIINFLNDDRNGNETE